MGSFDRIWVLLYRVWLSFDRTSFDDRLSSLSLPKVFDDADRATIMLATDRTPSIVGRGMVETHSSSPPSAGLVESQEPPL